MQGLVDGVPLHAEPLGHFVGLEPLEVRELEHLARAAGDARKQLLEVVGALEVGERTVELAASQCSGSGLGCGSEKNSTTFQLITLCTTTL